MILEKIKSFFKRNGKKGKEYGEEKTYHGQVVFVNFRKGYGFIKSDDFEENIFAHFKDCKTKIKKDKTVNFKIISEPKGLKAIEVEVLVQNNNDLKE